MFHNACGICSVGCLNRCSNGENYVIRKVIDKGENLMTSDSKRSYIVTLTREVNVRVAPDGGERKWECVGITHPINFLYLKKKKKKELVYSASLLDDWQIVVVGWWLEWDFWLPIWK